MEDHSGVLMTIVTLRLRSEKQGEASGCVHVVYVLVCVSAFLKFIFSTTIGPIDTKFYHHFFNSQL